MAAKTVADGVADRNPLYNKTPGPPKIRLPQMNAECGCAPQTRSPGFPPASPIPVVKDLCLQAGGPWGHSHYSQCYRRRADRQGCAVEVTRISVEGCARTCTVLTSISRQCLFPGRAGQGKPPPNSRRFSITAARSGNCWTGTLSHLGVAQANAL